MIAIISLTLFSPLPIAATSLLTPSETDIDKPPILAGMSSQKHKDIQCGFSTIRTSI